MRKLAIGIACLALPALGAVCASGSGRHQADLGSLEQMYAMCQRVAVVERLTLRGEMSKTNMGNGVWIGQVDAYQNTPQGLREHPRSMTCKYDVGANIATLY